MPNVLGRPHMLPERWWEYEMALPKTCARSSGDSGAPGCRWGTATAVLVWEGHACCGWGYAATVRWCFQSAMHAIAARAGTKSLVMEAGAVRLIWWSCSRSAVSLACCDADVVDQRWVHLRDPGARESEPATPPRPPTRSRPRWTSISLRETASSPTAPDLADSRAMGCRRRTSLPTAKVWCR
jgi:hypothetical protein